MKTVEELMLNKKLNKKNQVIASNQNQKLVYSLIQNRRETHKNTERKPTKIPVPVKNSQQKNVKTLSRQQMIG